MDTPAITPTSIPGVGLQHTARFGTSAVAMRGFTAGSLIMAEVPLLCTASLAVVNTTVARLKDMLPTMDPKLLHEMAAFCQADREVQSKVLNCIYSPDPAAVKGTNMLDFATKVAAAVAADKQLIKALGAASASEAEATALKVMLAWQANAWSFQRDKSALFEVGSKLAHTCGTPNTVYRSCQASDLTVPEEVRGKGCHVARRDIAAGELLTTTYLGLTLIQPSAVASRGWIDIDTAMGEVAPKGVVWYDLGKAAAGDATPWSCASCGAALADDDRQLFGALADIGSKGGARVEAHLQSLIESWDAELDARPISDVRGMMDKWAMVAKSVGSAHWATHRMYGLLAEMHAGELHGVSMDDGRMGQWMVAQQGLSEVVKDLEWHLEELQDDYNKMWEFMTRTTAPMEAAEAATSLFVRAAVQLLDAAETNLLPARPARGTSGSGSRQPVLEVQHQLAHLAGVLLQRMAPAVAPTQGWYLPHALLHDWEAGTKRCERVLALPVVALQDAMRLERGQPVRPGQPSPDMLMSMMMMQQMGLGAPPGLERLSGPSEWLPPETTSGGNKGGKKGAKKGGKKGRKK